MGTFVGICIKCGYEQTVTSDNPDACITVGCCVECEKCQKTKYDENASLDGGYFPCSKCESYTYGNYHSEYKEQKLCSKCGLRELKLKKELLAAHKKLTFSKVKSAKAKSVIDLALANGYDEIKHPYVSETDVCVYGQSGRLFSDTEVQEFIKKIQQSGKNVFARPAPLTPLHGFFDSRVIRDWYDLRGMGFQIWRQKADEILEQKEVLEIILMPEVSRAVFSGIVTSKSITIGRGNDGATNGKTAITVRTPDSVLSQIVAERLCNKYTKENESTFVEIVVSENAPNIPTVVQIRSGNEPDGNSNDFIPYNVTVKKVHEVTESTDLLAWQKLTASFKKGDVIHAQSLACHGAVHGVLHGIPVITTYRPQIGEKLIAGKITPIDYNRVSDLMQMLFSEKETYEAQLALYGWKFLHLTGSNFQAGGEEIVTFALFYTLLGGIAACLGEYRHASGTIKGLSKKAGSRNVIFERVFEEKKSALQTLFIAWQAFLDRERWSSESYGGPKWADCTHHTARLANRIGKFIKNPSEQTLKNAMETANELAHCMHNGGLLFTKFGNCESQAIGDIFCRKPVLEKLLQLKETIITEETSRFSFLKTLLRRLPDRLVKFEEYRKLEEERKRQELEKVMQECHEKACAAMEWLSTSEKFSFAISPYETAAPSWYTDEIQKIHANYLIISTRLNGESFTSRSVVTTNITSENAAKFDKTVITYPQLKWSYLLGNYSDGCVYITVTVTYEDIPEFTVTLSLGKSKLVHRIYDVYLSGNAKTEKEKN
jgi:hypothetical protein